MRVTRSSVICVFVSAIALLAAWAPPRHVSLRDLSVSPFAQRVLEYSPADGQFVNDPQFNDPARAMGAPVGGGTRQPDLTSLVTLGGFGGSITLGFERTIRDHPANPLGLDFIVYGNASWLAGLSDIRFAECAVIEVSRDVNRNGLADDAWFLIPGSHLSDPRNQHRNGFFLLPDDPYASPPLFNPNQNGTEAYWGYADMNPTLILGDMDGDNIVDNFSISPEEFYTRPDDPRTQGMTLGSGGGDGFDIAWAIDPDTGKSANLRAIDFIRITTAVDAMNGQFGEVSAEIDAVAAVAWWNEP